MPFKSNNSGNILSLLWDRVSSMILLIHRCFILGKGRHKWGKVKKMRKLKSIHILISVGDQIRILSRGEESNVNMLCLAEDNNIGILTSYLIC